MAVATQQFATIPEIVHTARQRLPANVWHYSCGGADTETTLRRNRTAFEYLAFNPRVLRGVTDRDLSTTFLGHKLSLPVMLAPVGSIGLFHPDGALAAHRVAQRAGTMQFVSTMSNPSLEDVRAGADGPVVFQIYVRGDREWLQKLINRVMRANYSAICLTVDSAAYGRRERDLHNRFVPNEAHGRPNLSDLPQGAEDAKLRDLYQAALTWEDVVWLRQICPLPLMIKGIQNAEDAKLAVEHGASVVYVSNHGGRQIDHVPATMEVLPEIVQAVAGRAEVIVDSGFLRGSDVVKAIALGAKAVLIGKLLCWGLGADGEDGLMRTLDLLRIEMSNVMANIGARTIADIAREHVRPSLPPLPAPWPVEPYFPE